MRRGLETAAERNPARCVAMSRWLKPPCCGLGAVDVDLRNSGSRTAAGRARRRRPGTRRNCSRMRSATARLSCQVGAFDLHVDRRRQSEVQDLGDHVRRQKIEGNAGKFAAPARAAAPRRNRRSDGDRGLSETRMSASAAPITPEDRVGQIDAAVRQADVVEDRVHLAAGMTLADARSPPGRRAARSLRCACRSWRAGAG